MVSENIIHQTTPNINVFKNEYTPLIDKKEMRLRLEIRMYSAHGTSKKSLERNEYKYKQIYSNLIYRNLNVVKSKSDFKYL